MSYLPLSCDDRKTMLRDIGVAAFEDLVASIPPALRDHTITLPPALSEIELQSELKRLARKNTSTSTILSFLGGGVYEHFIPAVVHYVISRSEFYTAYTPYQAEASQGTLQAIYEYQSMMCALTGMDVSNASHYDGATSMAEAAMVSAAVKGRKKVVIIQNVHPEYRAVLKTYLSGTALDYVEVGFRAEGTIDCQALEKAMSQEVACCIVQSPNIFGIIENCTDVERIVHKNGSHFVMVANPLSLARLKSPGEWNADIACGEGQVLGNPLSFGGPYLGYFATKKDLMRKIPGRLVGMTKDTDGKRAFTLTLQTREQHIRRERATSNICSNQALCALAAGVYLSVMGKEGLKRVADLNLQNAHYVKESLQRVANVEGMFMGPVFNEFVVKVKKDPERIIAALLKKGILAGLSLKPWYPALGNTLLICATETKTRAQLDHYIKAFATEVER